MKKFYIVKKAPCNGRRAGADNNVYTRQEAFDRARDLASGGNSAYVVLEAVAAFEPAAPPVRRVEIVDGDE